MEEKLIEFETAKLAKEKGFIHAYEFYNLEGELEPWGMVGGWIDAHEKQYAAPTQALLQRWLREKHNLDVFLFKGETRGFRNTYSYCILNTHYTLKDFEFIEVLTYEEALEDGLLEALKLIKDG